MSGVCLSFLVVFLPYCECTAEKPWLQHTNSFYSLFFSSVGYPKISAFTKTTQTTQGGFNLGGINATGQIPELPGNYGLIDKDTPESAFTKRSYLNDEEFVLVFSDEFDQDGRTFYAGDDPYWEAVDLHYWGTVRYQYSASLDSEHL